MSGMFSFWGNVANEKKEFVPTFAQSKIQQDYQQLIKLHDLNRENFIFILNLQNFLKKEKKMIKLSFIIL